MNVAEIKQDVDGVSHYYRNGIELDKGTYITKESNS